MNRFLARRVAARVRKHFNRPLFPRTEGIGLLPWISGPGVHTRLFLNAMREPLLNQAEARLVLSRFDSNGSLVEARECTLGHGRITEIDLPELSEPACGYCLFSSSSSYNRTVALQFHFQVMGPQIFAKTHGRAKGVPVFGKPNLADWIIQRLDPYPYSASTSVTAHRGPRFGCLFLNLSDRRCKVVQPLSGRAVADLPPHGSLLWFADEPVGPIMTFVGTTPFTFYVAMTRPDGTGLTLQHIKDSF